MQKKDNSVISISFFFSFKCMRTFVHISLAYVYTVTYKNIAFVTLLKNVTYKRTERYCYIIINIDGFIGNAIVIEIYIIIL